MAAVARQPFIQLLHLPGHLWRSVFPVHKLASFFAHCEKILHWHFKDLMHDGGNVFGRAVSPPAATHRVQFLPRCAKAGHDRRAHRLCFGDYHAEILEVARHEQARELCQLLKFLASRYETAEFHIFQPKSSHFAAQELLVCVISLAHNHEFAILRRWQLRYPIKKVLNLLYGVQPTKETKFSWQVVPQKGRFRCRHFV